MLVERAYAKINLTLDVIGRRPDGYHDVDMVMQAIDLSDSVLLERSDAEGIELDCNASQVPLDERNLAHQAASAFFRHTHRRGGLRIKIDKQIPVAAGLAGGSSDAAAVLRGLNRLFGTGLSLAELAEIGSEVGSDVPFCVYGGCAVATGRGERLQPVAHSLRAFVVLIRPPVHVSTAAVYQAMEGYTVRSEPSSRAMLAALAAGDVDAVRQRISNDLEPVTMRLYPGLADLKRRIEAVARVPVHMSGSGPTLYCLMGTQTAAQRLYNALRGFVREVYLSRIA
ncbi:MAG: 4-(cytidine 5'-diphospho)-2-C-methyl-D-erythritol kinase [Alicyclobacillus shizuokensis]|nr:4-(cytidine 5'-diphospho)-2-C-methyl-D-erythritol kinase [Alicyclobacillus shizuokensis]